jgi:DNA polymerase
MTGLGTYVQETDVTRSDLLKSLKILVEYHQGCGISTYPDGAEIHSSLNDMVVHSAGTEPAAATDRREADKYGTTRETGTAVSLSNGPLPMDELIGLIEACTSCPLHQGRQIPTPGSGGNHPELLVVGDWLTVPDQRRPEAGQVFGAEQDVMLWKMMGAIGRNREHVYVTNVIKCSVPSSMRPGAEHLSVCENYLKQQVALLSPRLICAMGPESTQTLLATTRSLSQLRGRFHTCKLPQGQAIKVMPTYHPSYLLKNPEMKRAAWADLQLIQKELDKK